MTGRKKHILKLCVQYVQNLLEKILWFVPSFGSQCNGISSKSSSLQSVPITVFSILFSLSTDP